MQQFFLLGQVYDKLVGLEVSIPFRNCGFGFTVGFIGISATIYTGRKILWSPVGCHVNFLWCLDKMQANLRC